MDPALSVLHMICGACGGGVRGYRGVLHGRPIADYKHTDVPPGTMPHRPILGTPVDQATLDRAYRPETVPAEKKAKVQPRHVRTSPARPDYYVESQSITTMLKVAEEEGWTVVDKTLRELDDGAEFLVFRWRRADLAAVGIWKRDDVDRWLFDDGYTLSKRGYSRVASTSLKDWLKARQELCPDCGRSSLTHQPEGECPS